MGCDGARNGGEEHGELNAGDCAGGVMWCRRGGGDKSGGVISRRGGRGGGSGGGEDRMDDEGASRTGEGSTGGQLWRSLVISHT